MRWNPNGAENRRAVVDVVVACNDLGEVGVACGKEEGPEGVEDGKVSRRLDFLYQAFLPSSVPVPVPCPFPDVSSPSPRAWKMARKALFFFFVFFGLSSAIMALGRVNAAGFGY